MEGNYVLIGKISRIRDKATISFSVDNALFMVRYPLSIALTKSD
jgi:hypothetical protein